MASLKKRGKTWSIRFVEYKNGKRREKTYSLGTTWKEIAEQREKELSKLHDQFKIDPFHPDFCIKTALSVVDGPKKTVLLGKAAERWLKTKSKLSGQTFKTYKSRVFSFIHEMDCEHMAAEKLSVAMVEDYLFRDGIKNATVRSDARHLSVFFNWLVERQYTCENPISSIPIPKKKTNHHDKMLTDDEFSLILKTFSDHKKEYMKTPMAREFQRQEWFEPMLACFFYGGFRLHEIAYSYDIPYSGLKFISLQKMEGMIWIPAGKGQSERFVPISKRLRPFLAPYLRAAKQAAGTDFVFAHPAGPYAGKAVTGESFRRVFKECCKRAGIAASRTPHGLRHQRITKWIEDGFSIKEASLMAGHSSTAVTESVYTHLKYKDLRDKMKELEG